MIVDALFIDIAYHTGRCQMWLPTQPKAEIEQTFQQEPAIWEAYLRGKNETKDTGANGKKCYKFFDTAAIEIQRLNQYQRANR